MIQLNKKILLIFVSLNIYSQISTAADLTNDLPTAFFSNYNITSEGDLVRTAVSADNSIGTPYVFDRSEKDGVIDWSVTSYPCKQNKAFRCIGIYKNEKSKVIGNQMSFTSSVVSTSGFTLLRMNPNNGEQNSVIKCNSKFTENLTQDDANLANCVEYSKANCKKWTDYSNTEEFKKVVSKAKECTDIMKSIDNINIQLRKTFQSEIKQSEKDIAKSFDNATHPDRKFSIPTDVEYSQDKLSPHISTYKDIFDRTSDCAKYESFFVKKYSGTYAARKIASDSGSKAGSGGTKVTPGAGKK